MLIGNSLEPLLKVEGKIDQIVFALFSIKLIYPTSPFVNPTKIPLSELQVEVTFPVKVISSKIFPYGETLRAVEHPFTSFSKIKI